MEPQRSSGWRTGVVVVGGGPAGMMLGYLLARAGVEVTVLEKHADFLRDFRGDTIHPSTLELMAELGVLEEFLDRPHDEARELRMVVDGTPIAVVDFDRLPTRCRFIAFMPQWDFLNFLARRAAAYPNFRLEMNAEVTGLLRSGDRVSGVRVRTPGGEVEISAGLVVGADGRHSVVREVAGLRARSYGVPIDVLWFRLPKAAVPDEDRPPPALGYITGGRMVLTIDRGEYWQVGVIIPKGAFTQVKAEGLQAFRDRVAAVVPFLRPALAGLDSFEPVSELSVQVDRLLRWHLPGLLCIGDAAHAMSPAFGVGVNYAVQDAVAAANALAAPLRRGWVVEEDLRGVQARREVPVRLMQPIQVALHRYLMSPRAAGRLRPPALPGPLRAAADPVLPLLRRGTGRVIGLGFRPEHIHTPDVAPRRDDARPDDAARTGDDGPAEDSPATGENPAG